LFIFSLMTRKKQHNPGKPMTERFDQCSGI
jgi:hypothetical protein